MSGSQEISKQQAPVNSMSVANIQSPTAAKLPAVPVFQHAKEEDRDEKNSGGDANPADNHADAGNNQLQRPVPDRGDFRPQPIQKKDTGQQQADKADPQTVAFKNAGAAAVNSVDNRQRFTPAAGKDENTRGDNSTGGGEVIQRKVTLNVPGNPVPIEMNADRVAAMNQTPTMERFLMTWVRDAKPRSYKDEVNLLKAAHTKYTTNKYAPGTFGDVVSSLLDKDGTPHFLPDPALWKILTVAFEANWFKAKECLAMGNWPMAATLDKPHPPHDKSLLLMQALVDMRNRKWLAFKTSATATVQAKLGDDIKILDAKGSDSLTSDMDLSVKGKESEAAITEFNTLFKTELGVPYEPGTVFDINLYSRDWMHGIKPKFSPGAVEGTRDAVLTPSYEPGLGEDETLNNAARAKTQEVWSFVKIMRNLGEVEIKDYKDRTLEPLLPKTSAKYIEISARLEEAQLKTTAFKAAVEAKAASMLAKFETDERDSKIYKSKSAFKDAAGEHGNNAHFRKEALNMRASNSIYQAKVVLVRQLRERINKVAVGKIEDPEGATLTALSTSLANAIAEALTYANEVYATEGGVLHTVLGKQEGPKTLAEYAQSEDKKDVKSVKTFISSNQYMESINENVGDSIHSLNHFSHMPQYASFRAGKYLDRLVEAVELLYEQEAGKLNKRADSFAEYAALKELGGRAVVEKGGKLGGDPLLAKTIAPFSTYTTKDALAPLKNKIIKFGAEVSGHFKKQV